LALPKPIESDNFSPANAVIYRMSVESA
jgi:hypothetical protein